MGCTLNYTRKDYLQAMQSLNRKAIPINPMSKENRDRARDTLRKASSKTLIKILSDRKNPAYQAVSKMLASAMNSKMTDEEKTKLPEAFLVVLKKQPNAMGLFEKAPTHRGPGSSAVQHHYEIFSAAALISGAHKSVGGKTLSINPGDRVDFGIKYPRGYAQPRRYGTIEADLLVGKSSLMDARTVGIDCKFSETGKFGAKDGLQRELDGIRTGFRDGKIDEFYFITNGTFGDKFKELVTKENLEIAKDYAARHNRLYEDETHGIDKDYLTEEEVKAIPPGKVPASLFREGEERVKEFISTYNIPQIDMCQHVKYPGT
jgi:hypothetical protein